MRAKEPGSLPSSAPAAPPALDLLAVGQLFLDVLYGPLPDAPELGSEVFSDSVTLCPGGIANFALAAAALGARAGIAARTGTGPASRLVTEILADAQIDTSRLRATPGHDLQVTSALAYAGDRALVTGGLPPAEPIGTDVDVTGAAAIAVHLSPGPMPWLETIDPERTRVFADVGWDPTGAWDTGILRHLEHCAGFLPNAVEATAYTRTDDPRAAARSLADLVPLIVVTCGPDGVIGIDSASGAEHVVPAVDLGPVDPTGAGDTFGAALITLLGYGLSFRDCLEGAALAATARAAGINGPSRTPALTQLAALAAQHRLACAEALDLLARHSTPTGSSKEQS